jgi:hypothetical protein
MNSKEWELLRQQQQLRQELFEYNKRHAEKLDEEELAYRKLYERKS